MKAIYFRELQAFFRTPLGYVFIGIYVALAGLFFWLGTVAPASTNYNGALNNCLLILLFLVPVLTMRLLSEEKRSKTDQLLLTSPVTLPSIVFGKFFAALTVYVGALLVTWLHVAMIAPLGQLEYVKILGGYLGMTLIGACFIAIGMLVSSLMENQLPVFLVSVLINISLWLVDFISGDVTNPVVYQIVSWLSLIKRYGDFEMGLLSLDSIVYYISFAMVFLMFTIMVIDRRRWSEG